MGQLHHYVIDELNVIAKSHDLKLYINEAQKRGWSIGAVFKNSVGETKEYTISLDPYCKTNVDSQLRIIQADILLFVLKTEENMAKTNSN